MGLRAHCLRGAVALSLLVGISFVPLSARANCSVSDWQTTPIACAGGIVPNKIVSVGGVLDIIQAKINTARGYEPGAVWCLTHPCGLTSPQSDDNNDDGSGSCKLQAKAVVTYNTNSYSGDDASGAYVQCDFGLAYLETNLSFKQNTIERRKNTHDSCDWRPAYEADTDCRTVTNVYEYHSCSNCRGNWYAAWTATLTLFNDEGYWVDWPTACTRPNPQTLTCAASGYAGV